MSAAREDLILKYAMACKRNAAEMAGMPITVICQHFREFADELAALSTEPGEAEGWRSMESAPKDGSWFLAVRRWPSGNIQVNAYQWEGEPNFWIDQSRHTCIRPDYQDKFVWSPIPATAPLPEDTRHGR